MRDLHLVKVHLRGKHNLQAVIKWPFNTATACALSREQGPIDTGLATPPRHDEGRRTAQTERARTLPVRSQPKTSR